MGGPTWISTGQPGIAERALPRTVRHLADHEAVHPITPEARRPGGPAVRPSGQGLVLAGTGPATLGTVADPVRADPGRADPGRADPEAAPPGQAARTAGRGRCSSAAVSRSMRVARARATRERTVPTGQAVSAAAST